MAVTHATESTPALHHAGSMVVTVLGGVGPSIAEKLYSRGITTLQDLWLHLPLRYEDRTQIVPIAHLRAGQPAQVQGRVEAVERAFRFRPVLRVAIGDESNATLVLRFFHFRAQQAQSFTVGRMLRAYGDVRYGQQSLEIVHPSYRFIDADDAMPLSDRLDAVYPSIEGLGPLQVSKLVTAALQRLPQPSELDLLPPQWLEALQLPSLHQALRDVHAPPVGSDMRAFISGQHPAQKRLAIEELLAHNLSLRRQRIALQSHGATPIAAGKKLPIKLSKALPFSLTTAQQRVLNEIRIDLAKPQPMLRLVQGDVGSGKTVVAAIAAANVVEAGGQVALMAPTELLAEQHLASFKKWFEPLNIQIAWLAGKVGGKARAAVLSEVASGTANIIIGTHALMQAGVSFAGLKLAIIDEQHRFGVHQRLALRDKGLEGALVPHQLVMTATPIPRTLAMAAYADLDVSIIDELPPGRAPVQTVAVAAERRPELVERIRAACAEGRQAYWVCPLIEESEEIEAQAAQTTYEQLGVALPELKIGLLHGRMKPAEKQSIMREFKQGDIQLLVATTIIEVGVDVPNASLMIIENAERLGLAQLHQLRGRVGRGSAASSCVLLYQSPLGAIAKQRIAVMRETNDGFVVAEKDLELRGPGELLGTRQTGVASFRVADLTRDAGLLPDVHRLAERLLAEQPQIADQLVTRWIGSAVRFVGA